MSKQSSNTLKSGTIASSVSDKMAWDLSTEDLRACQVLTVTSSVDTVLHWREAATAAQLASPPESLHHEFAENVTANTTLRIVIPRDPSLPVGHAWVATGSGNYSLAGGQRWGS